MRTDSVRWPAILLAIALASLQACSSAHPTSQSGPASGQAVDGLFTLTFEVKEGRPSAGEAIEGTATLTYTGSGGVDIWSSGGGPLNFGFAEVNGSRAMGPAWTADCRPGRLDAGSPIVSSIAKSGGFDEQDPDAPFYRSFFADPQVHLPPGNWWTITAVAQFTEGECGGPAHKLEAVVSVRVGEAPAVSAGCSWPAAPSSAPASSPGASRPVCRRRRRPGCATPPAPGQLVRP